MMRIDGRQGEGGGQILRSALALAAITGTPVMLEHIRGGRGTPGLRRQHCTSVQAAARVCSAHVEGVELGSQCLRFTPGPIAGGVHHIAIGTGGSTALVLQTVLPILLRAPEPSEVVVTGATHNPGAPSLDFLVECFLPRLREMGADIDLTMERAGFMSTGGGSVRMGIRPARAKAFALSQRGDERALRVTIHHAHLGAGIVERERQVLCEGLDLSRDAVSVRTHDATGPGNAICCAVEHDHICEVVTACGVRGKPAETVAAEAVAAVARYRAHDAPVGEHLADQLLLPLAVLAGGSFRTGPLSLHTRSNRDIIAQFLGDVIDTNERGDGTVELTVQPDRC